MNETMEKPAAVQAAPAGRVHLSVSPHVRARLSTSDAMFDVLLALLPATAAGILVHGLPALATILLSVGTAVLTEWLFDLATRRGNTLGDLSAVVTGLLLALCLPAGVPFYIPVLGALFAILVVKCLFGGLGKNFLNPALTARCFLLISFGSVMTRYTVDGVSAATPLTHLAAGDTSQILSAFLGSASGVIGSSILGLLLGGLFLWVVGGITFEIPLATLGSFVLFMALFGGQGFDLRFLLGHLYGGGIVMGALFMATDPVTSPVTRPGQLVYGAAVGVLSGLFRVFGSAADSVSYAIIISNLLVPILDQFLVPKPYGYRKGAQEGFAGRGKVGVPRSAIVLCAITLLAGVCLSGVYAVTKEPIEQQKLAASIASYQEVAPGASSFSHDDKVDAAVAALGGESYGAGFGKSVINEAVLGDDGSCVLSVTSGDAYDGTLTVAVGIQPDGTLNGISFTELHESAGMGMLCGEDKFKSQFAGVKVEKFTLNKAGGSTAEDEIDSVSGASVSSGAVVNAVNAALDFWNHHIKEGA